jgi:hypothetical protein
MAAVVYGTFMADGSTVLDDLIKPPLSTLLKSGYTIDITSGQDNTAIDVSKLLADAAKVNAALPNINISAHTSGLSNIQTLCSATLPAYLNDISYDYEKGYEPEYTTNFTDTIANFQKFVGFTHGVNKLAFGYPTGSQIEHIILHHWDYGELANICDGLNVQTQQAAAGGLSDFQKHVNDLISQFKGVNAPIDKLAVQFSLASSDQNHVVSEAVAVQEWQWAVQQGISRFYIQFNDSTVNDVVSFLQAIQ